MKALLFVTAILCVSASCIVGLVRGEDSSPIQVTTLAELLQLDAAQLAEFDIAWMNLLAAEGLPFSEEVNRADCLDRLQSLANKVRVATKANLYRFRSNPAEYENSEPFFRILVLITVVMRDAGLSYKAELRSEPRPDDPREAEFFRDSRDIFIHGLLSDKQTGTCSSIPVLLVALGRRLGYPLKLVHAKTHLFARWESDDGKTRMNIESTNGLNTHPDDFYKKWPFAISDEEVQSGQYLRSLTPREELASFMAQRACCLESNGRWAESHAAMTAASHLAPHIRRYANQPAHPGRPGESAEPSKPILRLNP